MARRASKKKSSPATLIAIAAGILAIIVAATLMSGGTIKEVSSDRELPIDDYLTRGSLLRDNKYTVQGKVEERFPGDAGEMISLLVKKGDTEKRLPIVVPQDKKSINIEREQEYRFTVRVSNIDDNKGILVVESMSACK